MSRISSALMEKKRMKDYEKKPCYTCDRIESQSCYRSCKEWQGWFCNSFDKSCKIIQEAIKNDKITAAQMKIHCSDYAVRKNDMAEFMSRALRGGK